MQVRSTCGADDRQRAALRGSLALAGRARAARPSPRSALAATRLRLEHRPDSEPVRASPSTAAGNVWITDASHVVRHRTASSDGLYKYDAYPSQTLLDAPDTCDGSGAAVVDFRSPSTRRPANCYVAQSNRRDVDIFDQNGNRLGRPGPRSTDGDAATSSRASTSRSTTPNGYSEGRVYLSLTAPENDVEALDAGQRPVDFPATASYINGNRLTGTPERPVRRSRSGIAVDDEGNIYVTDAGKKVVDEFDSTGIFLRAFPAPARRVENPARRRRRVDPTNGNVADPEADCDRRSHRWSTNTTPRATSSATITEDATPATFASAGHPGGRLPHGYLYVTAGDDCNERSSTSSNRAADRARRSPTSRSPTRPRPRARSTPTSIPTAAATSPPALRVRAPTTHPTAATAALRTGPERRRLQLADRRHAPTSPGLTTETTYHYRVVVDNANGTKYGADQTYTPHDVVGLTDRPGDRRRPNRRATLNGSFVGNGERHPLLLRMGPTTAYGNTTRRRRRATTPARRRTRPHGALGRLDRPRPLHDLPLPGRRRATAPATSNGDDQIFTTTAGRPDGRHASRSPRSTPTARSCTREVNPNGADTTVHFEYVDRRRLPADRLRPTRPDRRPPRRRHRAWASTAAAPAPAGRRPRRRAPSTTTASSPPTRPAPATRRRPHLHDLPVHARNQRPLPQRPRPPADRRRAAARLPRLRAGLRRRTPAAMTSSRTWSPARPRSAATRTPRARPQVLYGVHNGGIPGTGNPTNRGVDPYVATREPRRLDHQIRRHPRQRPVRHRARSPRPSPKPTPASTPSPSAGPKSARPASPDGIDRDPDPPARRRTRPGHGRLDTRSPAAEPAGFVGKHLSADGTHFVFGSTSQFEPDGNSNGDVSIYDRNLSTGDDPRRLEDRPARRQTMTATRRDRRARHLRRRLADRRSASWSPKPTAAKLLAPLHARRRLRAARSTSPRARPPAPSTTA